MPAGDLSSLKIHDTARAGGAAGKFWRIVAVSLGVLVIVAGAVLALRRKAPVVEVAQARAAGGAQGATLLNASGYVTPRRRATVAAKITGRVTGVFFDEGNAVREGQLLATLDDSDARRTLAAVIADRNAAKAAIPDLEAQLQYAEIELRRAQELHAGQIQSQEFLDAARTNVRSLQAKIDLAREQEDAAQARVLEAQQAVDNCVIHAPFSGIIVSKDAQVGEMVSPISAGGGFTRTGIATIVDMNSNEIEVDVNEAYIARVKPGQRVMATLDAYPDWQIPSHVRTIIPTADREKATVKVRISFDHLDPRILPDMGVKVAFLEDEGTAKQGAAAKAIIPRKSVRGEGAAAYVFVVRDGKLERRAVTLGNQAGDDVEVLAGINPGDELVVQGPDNLRDGQTVQVGGRDGVRS
ncbi:MAG TPA: efflux RND transporter periplasmic adaptor subunit [Thermoanaerobaculia bacterium]|nr:efflux RND transporter periplasmic adaptor subunit [Thermoanaerobaculia bacterium]